MAKFERPRQMLEKVLRPARLPESLEAPAYLTCEYIENPLGIEARNPRLAWQVMDGRRGAVQTAYQIQVTKGTFSELGPFAWDSGCVQSDASVHVPYGGEPLVSGARYYWRVRTWDVDGQMSAWSAPAWWEMGLLSEADWQGEWLSPDPLPEPKPMELGQWIWHPDRLTKGNQVAFFAYTLQLPEIPVDSARVQIASCMTCKLEVNGCYVGQNWNSGAHGADFPMRVVEYDLAPFLKPGDNLFLLHAWSGFDQPHAILGAEIRCGEQVFTVTTNKEWHAALTQNDAKPPYKADPASSKNAIELGSYEGHFDAPWPLRNGDQLPAHYFRKSFKAKRDIKEARVYICGLGYYELFVNGERIGDHVLDPAQTNYRDEALYVTYDVTEQLNAGDNVVGVHLADGWYNQSVVWGGMIYGDPLVRCMLAIEYDDGTRDVVATDTSWTLHESPVIRANVYWGEVYDARKEIEGWCEAELDDSGWGTPRVVPSPTKRLRPQLLPPIKRMQTLPPVSMNTLASGVFIYDMGQNLAGWVRLHVKSKEGQGVALRFSEMLDHDGSLWMPTTGTPHTHIDQTDVYLCKGDGEEVYEPHFTYHGFRYVEVTGLSEPPQLEAIVVHTAVETNGAFRCSDETLNRIHEMALWTEVDNLHGVPTDCPVRERCGWLGDAHVSAEMTIFNFDMAQFWAKYLSDIVTSLEDDRPTMIAPGHRTCGEASVDWGTALVQVPWYLYVYYGDTQILEWAYPYWRPWIDHMVKNAGDRMILEGGFEIGLGDWCPPGGNEHIDTPVPLTTTSYFYLDVCLAERVAQLLDKPQDAAEFAELAGRIKAAVVSEFFDDEANTFGSQTGDSVTLALGLVPEGREDAVAEALAHRIEDNGGHLHVGIMGGRFVNEVLTDHGDDATIYEAITKKDWPSIPFIESLGATTLWEVFGDNDDPEQLPTFSLNHPMQGGFDAWFYYGVAGIGPSADQPGFKHIVLRPSLVHQLEFAAARYESLYGTIESHWQRSGDLFEWRITVPANTTATVCLPRCDVSSIVEGGLPVENANSLFKVHAGTYHFAARLIT